jgi:structural maintenance of chromosome 2
MVFLTYKAHLLKEKTQHEANMSGLKATLNTLQTENAAISQEYKALEKMSENLNKKLEKERKSIAAFDKELTRIEKTKRLKNEDLSSKKILMQQLAIDFQNFKNDCETARGALAKLENSNPWIQDQKQYYIFIQIVWSVCRLRPKII